MVRSLLLWPAAIIFYLSKRVGQYLFKRGIWKSVEFELPVIAISSLSTVSIPVSHLKAVQGCLAGAVLMLSPKMTRAYGLSVQSEQEDLVNLKALDSSNSYVYSHLLLGISELSVVNQEVRAVILPGHKFISEVRPALRILMVNTDDLLLDEALWPVGKRTSIWDEVRLSDMVIAVNATADREVVQAQIQQVLGKQIPLFYGVENYDNDSTNKKSDKETVSGIFIDDHDNFARVLKDLLDRSHNV